ncbi:MAG TPA: 2-oxoacid:acceptor oxidoreductase family protein, partial [Dehalococcoidales bacterium]|nr:2-oxoacid:acceptor oxidoreductase family protein [Dehalococcoidales bacterium]
MTQIKQTLLCGYGGQGIVLAGTILGKAAFKDGKWVSGTNSYGAAARGGACRAEVVISDQPIAFPYLLEADVLIAMCQSAYDKYISQVKTGAGIVIYDDGFVSPRETAGLAYVPVPATGTAIEELGNEVVANIIMLGAAVVITGLVTEEALKAAVAETVSERLRELDLKAVDAGLELGRLKSLKYFLKK